MFSLSTPSPLPSTDTGWHDVRLVWEDPVHYEPWLDGVQSLDGDTATEILSIGDIAHLELYSRAGTHELDDVALVGRVLVPALPGAAGFGAISRGGRGGDAYYVTNTDDCEASDGEAAIPGSLRYGITTATGPRTIFFAVAGTISLKEQSVISNRIRIAGHTAPEGGICLKRRQTGVGGRDVILQHVRFRLGDDPSLGQSGLGFRRFPSM